MNVLETRGLGADITFAQDIVFITANRDDVLTIVLNFDTTHGLAEMAGPIVKLCWAIGSFFCHAIARNYYCWLESIISGF